MDSSFDDATPPGSRPFAGLDLALDPAFVDPALIELSKRLDPAMRVYVEIRRACEAAVASHRPPGAALKRRFRRASVAAADGLSALSRARVHTGNDVMFKLVALSPSAAFLGEQSELATLTLLALLEDVARLRTDGDAGLSSGVRPYPGPRAWS